MREKSFEEYLDEMKKMIKKASPEERSHRQSVPVVALPLDGQGSLIVVVNSAEERPLQGATVVISEPNSGKELYTLTTDQSGKTIPVRLAAPLKENSLEPNFGEIVYGLYNITASADGFIKSTLESIPVFDSVVSIQQIRLLMNSASGGENKEQSENEGNPYTL